MIPQPPDQFLPLFRNAYYSAEDRAYVGSQLAVLVKLSFIIGSFLIGFPVLLRMTDIVDNGTAFTFMLIGIFLVVIGETNRVRLEEASPYS